MTTAAVVLAVIGVALSVWSAAVLVNANQFARIPLWWGRPTSFPTRSRVARAIGAGLLVLATGMAVPAMGCWAVALVIVGGLVPIFQLIWHNQRQTPINS